MQDIPRLLLTILLRYKCLSICREALKQNGIHEVDPVVVCYGIDMPVSASALSGLGICWVRQPGVPAGYARSPPQAKRLATFVAIPLSGVLRGYRPNYYIKAIMVSAQLNDPPRMYQIQ